MSGRVLVAYYTHSGNTEALAQAVARATGGTLFKIEPEAPYPRAYNAVVEQAKREIRANHRPPLKGDIDVAAYDAVFVGTPNWWSTVAPPVATFLSRHSFGGARVFPFLTHGGGGEARIARDVKSLCPDADVSEPLAVYGGEGGGLDAKVEAWLRAVGFAGSNAGR
jgi:flavodoxin